jgi:hypothetical protein
MFTILYNLCKFEQNLPKEVVKDVNGIIILTTKCFQTLAVGS